MAVSRSSLLRGRAARRVTCRLIAVHGGVRHLCGVQEPARMGCGADHAMRIAAGAQTRNHMHRPTKALPRQTGTAIVARPGARN